MATMLAFLATDAAISAAMLDRALRCRGNGSTFNAITVDGDTSTNDTVALLANGESGTPARSSGITARGNSALRWKLFANPWRCRSSPMAKAPSG